MAGTLLGFLAASVYGVVIAVFRRDRSRVARDYASTLARLMRPALGLTTRVEGRERLTAYRPCVYIANHQSMYDVPVLADLYPEGTVVIGKRELRRIPFFGWLYELTGNVLIDRSDTEVAVTRLTEAAEAVRARGLSVWIFPEGTRGTRPGELLPFKKGAFYMAVAAGVPLVPIVVEPIRRFFDPERRRIRPGTVTVRVLEPIPTAGLTEDDVPELVERSRTAMQDALSDLARART
jgi:1-acyl-sn-glycerol-3-phosphate acyltransferase